MEYDEIVVLPSGTELSVEAALGDLGRAVEFLCDGNDQYMNGLGADLGHVAELLALLSERVAAAARLCKVLSGEPTDPVRPDGPETAFGGLIGQQPY